MKPDFVSAMDAFEKTRDSIILFNGEPIYVDNIAPAQNCLTITRLPNTNTNIPAQINYKDERISVKAPRLGYIDWEGSAVYMYREPMRNNVLGLSFGNNVRFAPRVQTPNIMKSGAMAKMLLNKYSRFDDVTYYVEQARSTSIAISREFALTAGNRGLGLQYCGDTIGVYHPDDRTFSLLSGGGTSFIAKKLTELFPNTKVIG